MRYAIVIKKVEGRFSASVPDLPGCFATGATVAEAETGIRKVIATHVEGLREEGLPVPTSTSRVEYIEVAA